MIGFKTRDADCPQTLFFSFGTTLVCCNRDIKQFHGSLVKVCMCVQILWNHLAKWSEISCSKVMFSYYGAQIRVGINKNSKWVWPGNTTITNRRQTDGTVMKRHTTITRHQEDKSSKAISFLFPIKMIAKLELTQGNVQQNIQQIVLQQRSPKVTCTHTGRVTSSIIHHFKA